MWFPPHIFWETVAPQLGLALLGNAISPLHGARAMGKLSILCALMRQSPLPTDYIAHTTDHILRLVDHNPAKVVPPGQVGQAQASTEGSLGPSTLPRPPQTNLELVWTTGDDSRATLDKHRSKPPASAPAPAQKDPQPHEPQAGMTTGSAHAEEVVLSPRPHAGISVAITVVTPGPNLIRVDVMDDRTMADFKAVLHILGHPPVVHGTFALDGRPFLDHTSLHLAGIQDGPVIAILPDLDEPPPCPPPPLSPLGDVQSATGSITQLLPGTLADAYELTLSLYMGAGGNADVQATHDTPIASLMEYAAGLARIPANDIAILHPNAGSLDEHGPNICDVPELGLWDRMGVHRHPLSPASSGHAGPHPNAYPGKSSDADPNRCHRYADMASNHAPDTEGMPPPDARRRGTHRAPYPGDHIARHNNLVGTQNLVGDTQRALRGSTPRSTGTLHRYGCMLPRNDGAAGALLPPSGGPGRGPA